MANQLNTLIIWRIQMITKKQIKEYNKKEEYKKKLDKEIKDSDLLPESVIEMLNELTNLYKN